MPLNLARLLATGGRREIRAGTVSAVVGLLECQSIPVVRPTIGAADREPLPEGQGMTFSRAAVIAMSASTSARVYF